MKNKIKNKKLINPIKIPGEISPNPTDTPGLNDIEMPNPRTEEPGSIEFEQFKNKRLKK